MQINAFQFFLFFFIFIFFYHFEWQKEKIPSGKANAFIHPWRETTWCHSWCNTKCHSTNILTMSVWNIMKTPSTKSKGLKKIKKNWFYLPKRHPPRVCSFCNIFLPFIFVKSYAFVNETCPKHVLVLGELDPSFLSFCIAYTSLLSRGQTFIKMLAQKLVLGPSPCISISINCCSCLLGFCQWMSHFDSKYTLTFSLYWYLFFFFFL